MSAESLLKATSRMVDEFTQSIHDLETLSLLMGDPNRDLMLSQFSQQLCHTEMLLDELDHQVNEDLTHMQRCKQVISRLQASKTRTRHLERNLPKNHNEQQQEDSTINAEEEDSTFVALNRVAQLDVQVDQITPPTQSEYDQNLPRYKKTITFDQFHRICEFVNQAALEKTKLMASSHRTPNNMNYVEQKKIQEWKQQDPQMDLRGLVFVTETDIFNVMDAKTTAVELRAALECLRHLGVLRVSALQELKRYVFLK